MISTEDVESKIDEIESNYKERGRVASIVELSSQEEKTVRNRVKPYEMINLSFGTLVVVDKPIGVEFRTPATNFKGPSYDPEHIEEKILDSTPGVVDRVEVTVSKQSNLAVVAVPYKEAYKSAIGLFLNERVRDEVADKGDKSDMNKLYSGNNKVKERVKELLNDTEDWQSNEMSKGSLAYKTRESGWMDGSNEVDRPW